MKKFMFAHPQWARLAQNCYKITSRLLFCQGNIFIKLRSHPPFISEEQIQAFLQIFPQAPQIGIGFNSNAFKFLAGHIVVFKPHPALSKTRGKGPALLGHHNSRHSHVAQYRFELDTKTHDRAALFLA